MLGLGLNKGVHVLGLGGRDQLGLDRLTSRGQLIDPGNLQIPVQEQGQGAGDGGGAHDQHMDAGIALVLDGCPLADSKAVLFVGDDKLEVGKHTLLPQ